LIAEKIYCEMTMKVILYFDNPFNAI